MLLISKAFRSWHLLTRNHTVLPATQTFNPFVLWVPCCTCAAAFDREKHHVSLPRRGRIVRTRCETATGVRGYIRQQIMDWHQPSSAFRHHRTILHLCSQRDRVGPTESPYSAAGLAVRGRKSEGVQARLAAADRHLTWIRRRRTILGLSSHPITFLNSVR